MRTGAHKDRGGVTIERWSDQLAIYLDNQSAVESLRESDMPEFPWPDADNPMLAYLVQRSEEMAESDGRPASVVWLAVHAWFEGALYALAADALRAKIPLPTCNRDIGRGASESGGRSDSLQ